MAKQTKVRQNLVNPGQRAHKAPRCPECGRRQRHSGHRGQKPVKAGGCHLEFGPTHFSREERTLRAKAAAVEIAAQTQRKAERTVRRELEALRVNELAAEAVEAVAQAQRDAAERILQAQIEEEQRVQDLTVTVQSETPAEASPAA
jgi:hypothetical protein